MRINPQKTIFELFFKVKEAIGSACAAQVQAVTSAFEHAWNDAALQQQLFKLFNTTPSRLSKADFAWMLADSAAMGDQYGCERFRRACQLLFRFK